MRCPGLCRGCGIRKTVVAFLALLLAGLNGYQGALMAPTEVLARQHYENISGMLGKNMRIPLKGRASHRLHDCGAEARGV